MRNEAKNNAWGKKRKRKERKSEEVCYRDKGKEENLRHKYDEELEREKK